MIWILIAVFFVLSPLYAWGMIKLFGTNFRWSLAASGGIACIISAFYLSDLISLWILSLIAATFYAAYPGMLYHDLKYRQMLREERLKLISALEAVLDASDNPEIKEIYINTSDVRNWTAVYEAKKLIDQYKDVTEWKRESFLIH